MSKTKRPIKRVDPNLYNYGLDTPEKRLLAKVLREIFEVKK